jgi:hypothetical protein
MLIFTAVTINNYNSLIIKVIVKCVRQVGNYCMDGGKPESDSSELATIGDSNDKVDRALTNGGC